MAEIKLNKQHPLYQEDLTRILEIPEIEKIKGKSFLITGATGLIGTCLVDTFMYYNHQGGDIQIYAVGRSWKGQNLSLEIITRIPISILLSRMCVNLYQKT